MPKGLELGDLNNDGLLDVILTTGWDDEPIYMYFTEEDAGAFSWSGVTFSPGTESGWDYCKAADMDSDADIDLVIMDSDYIKFFENLDGVGGDWMAHWVSTVAGANHFHQVNLGDIDGDMMPDIIYPGVTDGIYWRANPFEYNSVEESAELPETFELVNVYPNPFNPTTTVQVNLAERARVQARVFDLTGRQVATLANGNFEVGQHAFSLDGSKLSSGIYLLQVHAGADVAGKKLVLLK
jgi:hypothetical protein